MNDIEKVVLATYLAAQYHRSQRRKARQSVPYVNHCISAALMHDVLEDCCTAVRTFDMLLFHIRESLGGNVAELVLEVTDDKRLSKEDRKRIQIEKAPHASPDAKLIKLADKYANIVDTYTAMPTFWSAEQGAEYIRWSGKVVTALGPVNAALEDAYWKYHEASVSKYIG